jgi:hypothetical protein
VYVIIYYNFNNRGFIMDKQAILEQIREEAFRDEMEKVATMVSAARKVAIRQGRAIRSAGILGAYRVTKELTPRITTSAPKWLKSVKAQISPSNARELFLRLRKFEKSGLKDLSGQLKDIGVKGSAKEFARTSNPTNWLEREILTQ